MTKKYNPVSVLSYYLLLVWGIYVFAITFVTPWVGDDLEYMNMAVRGSHDLSGKPVRSLGDIFVSQWYHYSSINGRSVAHFLVQLFCALLGQKVFAFFNAIVYVFFIVLIARFSSLISSLCEMQRLRLVAILLVSLTFNT